MAHSIVVRQCGLTGANPAFVAVERQVCRQQRKIFGLWLERVDAPGASHPDGCQDAEVTQVCTRLVILNKGAVHYANTMAEALTLRPHVTIEADRPLDDLAPLLTALDPGIVVEERMITLNEPAIHLRRHILSIVLSAGFDVLDVARSG